MLLVLLCLLLLERPVDSCTAAAQSNVVYQYNNDTVIPGMLQQVPSAGATDAYLFPIQRIADFYAQDTIVTDGATTTNRYEALNLGFCDQGDTAHTCLIENSKVFLNNNTVSLSSNGLGSSSSANIPFQISQDCQSSGPELICSVHFQNFIPSFSVLTSLQLQTEVINQDFSDSGKFVEWTKLGNHSLQGVCRPNGAESCQSYFQCMGPTDIFSYYQETPNDISVSMRASSPVGNNVRCGTARFLARITITGQYSTEGVLNVNSGGIYCTTPNCTLHLSRLREVVIAEGAVLYADNIQIEVPRLVVNGAIRGRMVSLIGAAVVVGNSGWITTNNINDTQSSLLIDMVPSRTGLFMNTVVGCSVVCYPCDCTVLNGTIVFPTMDISSRYVSLGTSGWLSADGLGWQPETGPGAGHMGGGGAFGGNGATSCGHGSSQGSLAYGNSSAPFSLGSGGGNSQVAGGRGGGRIWIKTVSDIVVNGKISANGQSSRCNIVQQLGYSSGGGGSGGSVLLTGYGVLGAGLISTNGGDARFMCDNNCAVAGGGGSGGRIALNFQTLNSGSLTLTSRGGRSGGCSNGAAGTIFQSHLNSLIIENGSPEPTGWIEWPNGAPSALTPFPPDLNPAVVFISNAAAVTFPTITVDRIFASAQAALIATPTSPTLRVNKLSAIGNCNIGCLMCNEATLASNGFPGCTNGNSCPNVVINVTDFDIQQGSRILASNLTMNVTNFTAGKGVTISASDLLALSGASITAGNFIFNGTARFSSMVLTVSGIAQIGMGSTLDASSMGYHAGTGPGAGTSSVLGGGGGSGAGHGGFGAAACNSQTSIGGSPYGSTLAPWDYGSGGGYGGILTATTNSTFFLASDAISQTVAVFSRNGGSVHALGGSCSLRGSQLGFCGTCCPFQQFPSSLAWYCCPFQHCDCAVEPANQTILYSPGGRGGGRIKIVTPGSLLVDGLITVDGESASCFGIGSAAGGGGSAGSIWIQANEIVGVGSLSAVGGSSFAGCSLGQSGGAGSGGKITLNTMQLPAQTLAIHTFGGTSDGCTSGATGFFYMYFDNSLMLDGGDNAFIYTAPTLLPDEIDARVITIRHYSIMLFPSRAVENLVVELNGALMVSVNSTFLNVSRLLFIQTGASVGCLPCVLSGQLRNEIPGCMSNCPAFSIHLAGGLQVANGSRVMGVNFSISCEALDLSPGSLVATSDELAFSIIVLQMQTAISVAGTVRASTIKTSSATFFVDKTGQVVADALGSMPSTGLGAGGDAPANGGGGGGGHGGYGANGCSAGSGGMGGWSHSPVNFTSSSSILEFGSGGGASNTPNGKQFGGRGGGIIDVVSSADSTIDGVVTANGEPRNCSSFASSGPGGGSGGTVRFTASTLTGTGVISVVGGPTFCPSGFSGGGGSGGRMFLLLSNAAVAPSLNLFVRGGPSQGCTAGASGTIFSSFDLSMVLDSGSGPNSLVAITPFPPATYLSQVVVTKGAVLRFPPANATVTTVSVSNGGMLLAMNGGFNAFAASSLYLASGGIAGCSSCTYSLLVGNGIPGCFDTCPSFNLTVSVLDLSQGAAVTGISVRINAVNMLARQGAILNSTSWDYTSSLVLQGDVLVLEGNVVHSSIEISSSNAVTVSGTGRIDTSSLGYLAGIGPGAGNSSDLGGSGGGNGGQGRKPCANLPSGKSPVNGGIAVGFDGSVDSWEFGSGGGNGNLSCSGCNVTGLGGRGGGRIKITSGVTLSVEGIILADGGSTQCRGRHSNPGGGGAGGSIYLEALKVLGSGVVSAAGGNSTSGCFDTLAGGGGGGGRITVSAAVVSNSVGFNVQGGNSDCTDCQIGRYCDTVREDFCLFKQLQDEIQGQKLVNPNWIWKNAPAVMDVGITKSGWLTISPVSGQMLSIDTAHQLYIKLNGDDPFDVETHLLIQNMNSRCVNAGLFARGVAERDWVTIGLLDTLGDALVQLQTRGTSIHDVPGVRQNDGTSVYLRLVGDTNGAFNGYWKTSMDADWVDMVKTVYRRFSTMEVGIFVGQCEVVGDATVSFEYVRDNTCRSINQGIKAYGQSGILIEKQISGFAVYASAVNGNDVTGDGSVSSPVQTLSKATTVKQHDVQIVVVQSGNYSVSSLDVGSNTTGLILTSLQQIDFRSIWNSSSASAASFFLNSDNRLALLNSTLFNSSLWNSSNSNSSNINTTAINNGTNSTNGNVSIPANLTNSNGSSNGNTTTTPISMTVNILNTYQYSSLLSLFQEITTKSQEYFVHRSQLLDLSVPTQAYSDSVYASNFASDSKLFNATNEPTIIRGGMNVNIDCQGDDFFSWAFSGGNVSLYLVDVQISISNCVFSNAKNRAISITRSIVLLRNCAFENLEEGGIDAMSSLIDIRNCTFSYSSATEGASIRVGLSQFRTIGVRRWGTKPSDFFEMSGVLYVANSVFSNNIAFTRAGAILLGLETMYAMNCLFLGNQAADQGGAFESTQDGVAILVGCLFTNNSAARGGAISTSGGTISYVDTVMLSNLATLNGGAAYISPVFHANRLKEDGAPQYRTGYTSLTFLRCSIASNGVIGITSHPGGGGAITFSGGGAATFISCALRNNTARSAMSVGGCFELDMGGTIYLRDTVIMGHSATNGGVIRVYATAVGSTIGALFDNCTFISNIAGRKGSILSFFTATDTTLSSFSFSNAKFYSNLDPWSFFANPLLRFGFRGNPIEDPYWALIKPAQLITPKFNPLEDPHYQMELPNDGHLTNQWPFLGRDQRTVLNQKVASGGNAFVSNRTIVAFKDCGFYGNMPQNEASCYWHAITNIQQCFATTDIF